MRENCTSGSARGVSGNRRSYRKRHKRISRLDELFLSINYKIHSSITDDPIDWIKEINGEVFICEEDGEKIVAQCRHFFIDLENSKVAADYLLDIRHEIAPFISLYESGTSSFTEEFLDIMEHDIWNSNLLVIDRIEILPNFRGKGLAGLIIEDAINSFSPRTDLAVLKAFPLQLEYKTTKHKPKKWERMMALSNLENNEAIARNKLISLYKSLGFIMIENNEIMARKIVSI
jgi:hypothetical protein